MSITKRNDAKGFVRGAGTYSQSPPKINDLGAPDKSVDRSGQVNEVGSRNKGLAAPVSKDSGRGF